MPVVSIITSNYNGSAYLADCVSSVLKQDFDAWEHIIIDCGSTDNSLTILESLKHPRLRIIHEKFCGVAHARNLAIQQAQGEFCAILDADDMALPNRLRLQVELLAREQQLIAIGGNVQAVYPSGQTQTVQYPLDHDEIMSYLNATLSPILHSTLTFQKSVFQDIGGYREAMEKSEDYDLILRFGLQGRLGNVNQPVGVLRLEVADSHTRRHLPQGRDVEYYAVLALLFNTARVQGIHCTQEDIEAWLDRLGKKGISALKGRWIWENLIKHHKFLSSANCKNPLKAYIHFLLAMISCFGKSWWPASSSPELIIKECIVQ